MKTVNVRILGSKPKEFPETTTLLEVSNGCRHLFNHRILLAKVNNAVSELHCALFEDCDIEFLDITDPHGYRAYQRSAVLLMVYAVKKILGKDTRVIVNHSINKNYYCEIEQEKMILDQKLVDEIKKVMNDAVRLRLPIEKLSLPVQEAARICREFNLQDKIDILKFRRVSNVNLYRLDGFYDYFYGPMVPDAGYLSLFELHKDENRLILHFPSLSEPAKLSELKPLKKMSAVFKEANDWSKILDISTVGKLNSKICGGNFREIIHISEALHEKKIAYIADAITSGHKRIVLIAGPSSSGKTTFAERLCIQLRVNGLNPYVLSLDNYFFNRDDAPIGEDGLPDYDSFSFMDSKLLNENLTAVLAGQIVDLPYYNFFTGKREFTGRTLRVGDGDILVLEGIHALNSKLTYSVADADKFKIFISALTQLNIDDHNRIPTTDTRLLRRIVRDHQFRGTPAWKTIKQWPSVVNGEAKNIFPFQEEADAFFNSALIYEMSILKQYAEPLLFDIEKTLPEYADARRLVKLLDCFMGVGTEGINNNSILREFIGGSCFDT